MPPEEYTDEFSDPLLMMAKIDDRQCQGSPEARTRTLAEIQHLVDRMRSNLEAAKPGLSPEEYQRRSLAIDELWAQARAAEAATKGGHHSQLIAPTTLETLRPDLTSSRHRHHRSRRLKSRRHLILNRLGLGRRPS